MRSEDFYGGAAHLDLSSGTGNLIPNYRVVTLGAISDAVIALYDPILKHARIGPGLHFLHDLSGFSHELQFNSQIIGTVGADGTSMVWFDGTDWRVDKF